MDKVIAFVKSWQFMLGFFILLTVASSVLLVWGLTHDDEPGLMPTAPQWERRQFPLRVYVNGNEADAAETRDDRALAASVIHIVNSRLGFEAFRLLAEHDGHEFDVFIIPHEGGRDEGCPPEGGQTRFGYVAPSGEYPEGDGASVTIALCNVPLAELRTLALEHEFGHTLGLAHDPDNEQSIMQPVLHETRTGDFPPHISDHDRALLRDLYAPRGQ